MGMDAQIRIIGGTGEELSALSNWLSAEAILRGRVRMLINPISDTELGSIPELLNVALGAGGAGTVLASSLITWLKTRRTKATITVETQGHSVTLDIETVNDVEPLLKQILHTIDND
jgi:hypothetical protein